MISEMIYSHKKHDGVDREDVTVFVQMNYFPLAFSSSFMFQILEWEGFGAYALMGSLPLMTVNEAWSFNRAQNKSLSFSTTDNGRAETVFAGRTMLSSVLKRQFPSVFGAIRVGFCPRVKYKHLGISWNKVCVV